MRIISNKLLLAGLTLISLLLFSPVTTAKMHDSQFIALCYHNITDSNDKQNAIPGAINLQLDKLIEQFNWLKAQGYKTISLQQLQTARDGGPLLPEKSVLLTFDDGYTAVYHYVFPLLKLYNFRAVIALTGNWLASDTQQPVQYGDDEISRDHFLQWSQIREMRDSGLVEIASHSYDLHKYIPTGRSSVMQPAAVSLSHSDEDQVESVPGYRMRILNDLFRNQQLLQQQLGEQSDALMWPYGRYNHVGESVAQQTGHRLTFTLNSGHNRLHQALPYSRAMISHHMPMREFANLFKNSATPEPIRALQIDMDYLDDDDDIQRSRNLDALINYLRIVEVNTVYLQAFADHKGDGVAREVYFLNRHLPVKRDLFNHVANAIRSHTGAKVYAWMPVLSYTNNNTEWRSINLSKRKQDDARLSVFHPQALQYVREIFEDLARGNAIDGILYHDDGLLSDFEDFSPVAIKAMKQAGLPVDIRRLRKDPVLLNKWTALKSRQLIRWTRTLTAGLRKYRPHIKTARNLFSQPVINPDAVHWYAQDLKSYSAAYDYIAVLAMPWLEKQAQPGKWYKQLLQSLNTAEVNPEQIVLTLQTRDWTKQQALDDQMMHMLVAEGQWHQFRHYALYPVDFIKQQPAAAHLRNFFSSASFPFRR